MPDLRSEWQKKKDSALGMPLYYCAECKLEVSVTTSSSGEVIIKKPCSDCKAEVIAPRRAIAVGKGGVSIKTQSKILFYKLLAYMTGRCV